MPGGSRYLRDVLLRVATHPHSRIADLTPHGWAKNFGPNAQPSPPDPYSSNRISRKTLFLERLRSGTTAATGLRPYLASAARPSS